MQNAESVGDQLVALLKEQAAEAGTTLSHDLKTVAAYASERVRHLTSIAAEPGFRLAVIAERDSIALMAAGRAIDQADATDARLIGIIDGALTIAVGALV